jgi:hypothetical protein
MKFNFKRISYMDFEIDFELLFKVVTKDMHISVLDNDMFDRISREFTKNTVWYLDKYILVTINQDQHIYIDMIYEEINKPVIEVIAANFRKFIETKKI